MARPLLHAVGGTAAFLGAHWLRTALCTYAPIVALPAAQYVRFSLLLHSASLRAAVALVLVVVLAALRVALGWRRFFPKDPTLAQAAEREALLIGESGLGSINAHHSAAAAIGVAANAADDDDDGDGDDEGGHGHGIGIGTNHGDRAHRRLPGPARPSTPVTARQVTQLLRDMVWPRPYRSFRATIMPPAWFFLLSSALLAGVLALLQWMMTRLANSPSIASLSPLQPNINVALQCIAVVGVVFCGMSRWMRGAGERLTHTVQGLTVFALVTGALLAGSRLAYNGAMPGAQSYGSAQFWLDWLLALAILFLWPVSICALRLAALQYGVLATMQAHSLLLLGALLPLAITMELPHAISAAHALLPEDVVDPSLGSGGVALLVAALCSVAVELAALLYAACWLSALSLAVLLLIGELLFGGPLLVYAVLNATKTFGGGGYGVDAIHTVGWTLAACSFMLYAAFALYPLLLECATRRPVVESRGIGVGSGITDKIPGLE